MSRKRSIASLLDDLDEESPSIQSSSVAHSHRNRSIASIVNEETASFSRPSSNIRKKVICNCPDCNGKLVDSRIKELYELNSHIKNIKVHKVQFGLIFSNLK